MHLIHYDHVNQTHVKYASRKIGHEQAIGEMDAAFARSGTKTESRDIFGALVGYV